MIDLDPTSIREFIEQRQRAIIVSLGSVAGIGLVSIPLPGVGPIAAMTAASLFVGVLTIVSQVSISDDDPSDTIIRPTLSLPWSRTNPGVDPTDDPAGALDEQGFERLTDAVIERRPIDRETCWRREFWYSEIADGIPVDRRREDGTSVPDELLEDLADGGTAVLVGPAGSGKTTVAKQVAHRWHADGGEAFVRSLGRGMAIQPGTLRRAVEALYREDPVLLVVEDAARAETLPILEVVNDCQSDRDVSILLTSRTREWDALDERAARHDAIDTTTDHGRSVLRTVREHAERRAMPWLDTDEIDRIRERFEAVAGRPVGLSAGELEGRIDAGIRRDHSGGRADGAAGASRPDPVGVSRLLLLVYQFPVGNVAIDPDEGESALEAHVGEVWARVATAEADPAVESVGIEVCRRVALLANVLNAAELPVRREWLEAIDAPGVEIDAAIEALDGMVLFGEDDVGFVAPHPFWSLLYLERSIESDERARESFEEVVNALFEHVATADIDQSIDDVVKQVFNLAKEHPPLEPLFRTTDASGIDIPNVCSDSTVAKTIRSRSDMFRRRGDYAEATTELEQYRDRIGGRLPTGIYRKFFKVTGFFGKRSLQARSQQLNRLGVVAQSRGEYDEAERFHRESLGIDRDLDDRAGEAKSLGNLGLVARSRGEYDEAERYHRESLEIDRDLDDRAGEAKSLNNLGLVARSRGEYDEAERFHRESLEIDRDLDDRAGEAKSLNSLGLVAQSRGEYDEAERFHRESLGIARDLDDRAGKAKSLGNLGNVAQRRGEYDEAKRFHRESLGVARDLDDRAGEATSLNNLGNVAQRRGEYDEAERFYRESLEIARDLDDRAGEAKSLGNLGVVAEARGEYDEAERYHRESLEIARDLDDRAGEAKSLGNLGVVARRRREYDEAERFHRESLEIKRDLDDRAGEAKSLGNLGVVARRRREYDEAERFHRESLEIKRDLDDRAGEATSLNNLGLVAQRREEYEEAITHYEEAATIFAEIGALRELLTTFRNLYDVAVATDDEGRAIEWCDRALDTIESADPDLRDERLTFEVRRARLDDSL